MAQALLFSSSWRQKAPIRASLPRPGLAIPPLTFSQSKGLPCAGTHTRPEIHGLNSHLVPMRLNSEASVASSVCAAAFWHPKAWPRNESMSDASCSLLKLMPLAWKWRFVLLSEVISLSRFALILSSICSSLDSAGGTALSQLSHMHAEPPIGSPTALSSHLPGKALDSLSGGWQPTDSLSCIRWSRGPVSQSRVFTQTPSTESHIPVPGAFALTDASFGQLRYSVHTGILSDFSHQPLRFLGPRLVVPQRDLPSSLLGQRNGCLSPHDKEHPKEKPSGLEIIVGRSPFWGTGRLKTVSYGIRTYEPVSTPAGFLPQTRST